MPFICIWVLFFLTCIAIELIFECIVKPIGYFIIWFTTELEYFHDLKKLENTEKSKNNV